MSDLSPGPWFVDEDSIDFMLSDSVSVGYRDHHGSVAHIAHLTRGLEAGPAFAHARLLAAAPEMFQHGRVLAMMGLQSDRYHDDPEYRNAVDGLLAVVAKAEGR